MCVVIVRHSGCCLVSDVCVAVIVRHSGCCLVCDVCVAVIVRRSGYCLVCDRETFSLRNLYSYSNLFALQR